MKIHDLAQGSDEWRIHRAQHWNASDAPAMMGVSPYKTRTQLLRELRSGVAPDVDAAGQKRFDDGHRFEALARTLAEEILGDTLYPLVGSMGRFSASFDGLTLDGLQGFEHKVLNDELRERMKHEDNSNTLPLYHRVQMEQQLLVSGAQRILFMASEWTADDQLIEERHCWYASDKELRQRIIMCWAQFENDLAVYTPLDHPAPPVGAAPETLPALRIEISGAVTASNLSEFKDTALSAIRGVNRELSTDQHFADAEKSIRWCEDVEQRLAAAKEHALSQTASIDVLFKTIDDIKAEARQVRLDLEKLVTRRKTEIKDTILVKAGKAYAAHVQALEVGIEPVRIVGLPAPDFAAAAKGKRSLAMLQDAVDTALANAKIRANAAAEGTRACLGAYRAAADGYEFLFADLQALVQKPVDDLLRAVVTRIDAHKAEEARRAEERAKATAALMAAAPMPAAAVQFVQTASLASAAVVTHYDQPIQSRAVIAPDEPATLKLGQICDRLGFVLNADFIKSLGISPSATDKNAKLYRESQFALICQRLVIHIAKVAGPGVITKEAA